MFKIVENKDGTTTVFCNESGRVICSVPKMRDKPLGDIQPTFANILCETRKNLRKRAIKKRTQGIGRPIPRAIAAPSAHDQNKTASTSTGSKSSDPLLALSTFPQIVPMICPLPPEGIVIEKCIFERDVDPYIDAEISGDSLTQVNFLLTLGLIPEEKQKNDDWRKLREDLPTRFISRTNSIDTFRISSDRKIYEECDLVSPIGLKFLNDTPEGQKCHLDTDVNDSCVKKYNHYCSLGCALVNGPTAHYSMRDREVKVYPVTFKPKTHQEYSHIYCFNSPQRQEQKKRIRTGLTKRSRKLKALCRNRGDISIKLVRLSDKEIKERTRRRPPPPPELIILDDDSDIEIEVCDVTKMDYRKKNYFLLNSCSKTNPVSRISARVASVSQSPLCSRSLSHLRKPKFSQIYANKAFILKKCHVRLHNVLEQLEKKLDGTYVKNTRIKVRQIDLKAQLAQSRTSVNAVHSYARLHHDKSMSATSHHYDHPYYRSNSSQALAKKHVLNGLSRQQYVNGSVLAQKSCGAISLVQPLTLARNIINHQTHKFQSSINHTQQIVVKPFSVNHPTSSHNPINSCDLPNIPAQIKVIPAQTKIIPAQTKSIPAQTKIIPIVDLASEDENETSNTIVPFELPRSSKTNAPTVPATMSLFYCYACDNYKKSFRRKDDAYKAARKHLTTFHSVLQQPEVFLKVGSDSSNQCVLVEAFPGYKSS